MRSALSAEVMIDDPKHEQREYRPSEKNVPILCTVANLALASHAPSSPMILTFSCPPSQSPADSIPMSPQLSTPSSLRPAGSFLALPDRPTLPSPARYTDPDSLPSLARTNAPSAQNLPSTPDQRQRWSYSARRMVIPSMDSMARLLFAERIVPQPNDVRILSRLLCLYSSCFHLWTVRLEVPFVRRLPLGVFAVRSGS